MTRFYDSAESKRGVMTNALFSIHMSHFDLVAPSNMTMLFLFPMAHSRRRFGT
jgi:hypothetical protein